MRGVVVVGVNPKWAMTEMRRHDRSFCVASELVVFRVTGVVRHILVWVATLLLSFWKEKRMDLAHTELDLRERRTIEDMQNAKVPVSKIPAKIGRHHSTIYREIKRNFFKDHELPYLNGNFGMVVLREASKRRVRRPKLIRLDDPLMSLLS